MALKNSDNLNYLKIDFTKCKIMNGSVYACYEVYASERDRQKEKQRFSGRAAFSSALRQFIRTGRKELDGELNAYGFDPYNPGEDPNKLPGEVFTRLRQKGSYYDRFAEIESLLPLKFWRRPGEETIALSLDGVLDKLIELGFEPEWIDDPVNLDQGAVVDCGPYNGEAITPSLFYNGLKNVILNPLEDC